MDRRALRSGLLVALLAVAPVLLLAPGVAAQAVEAGDTLRVELQDGTTFIGIVRGEQADSITFTTASGASIAVRREQIASMAPASGRPALPADRNRTRLFFGPTGRMMAAGEGYIAAYELFLPFVSYSPTDWFAIAGGTPLVPDAMGEVVYLAPKVGLMSTDQLAVSAGVLALFSTETDLESAGILFGVGTWGSSDRAVTAAVGWPFASGDLAQRPTFMGGGELRMSPRTKLISENYLITVEGDGLAGSDAAGLISGGVRFIGDRLSGDLGLGYAFDGDDGICCFPLVNFVYHFGGE